MTDRKQTDNNNSTILSCKCNLQGLWIGFTNGGIELSELWSKPISTMIGKSFNYTYLYWLIWIKSMEVKNTKYIQIYLQIIWSEQKNRLSYWRKLEFENDSTMDVENFEICIPGMSGKALY